MSRQLELNLAGSDQGRRGRKRVRDLSRRGLARSLRAGLSLAVAWAPAWVSLAFLVQLTWFGFVPAWGEMRRLDRAEAELELREGNLLRDHAMLMRDREKLADVIYRERVRRSLTDPERGPLLLESSRAAERK